MSPAPVSKVTPLGEHMYASPHCVSVPLGIVQISRSTLSCRNNPTVGSVATFSQSFSISFNNFPFCVTLLGKALAFQLHDVILLTYSVYTLSGFIMIFNNSHRMFNPIFYITQSHVFHSSLDVEQHQSTGQLGSDATSSSAESTQTHLSDGHVRGPIRPVHHRTTSPNFSQ